jgi:hypothetical protein
MTMTMRFKGKVSEDDLSDLRKMLRSKWYWPKFVFINWYGIGLTCVLVWATLAPLLGKSHPNWQALGLLWAVVAGIITWAVYRTKKAMAREYAQLNARLPDTIDLKSDGVKLDGPEGATSFLPWRNFAGWREGHRVILIDQSDNRGFVIVPVVELSDIEKESLRQILRSHISATIPARVSV